MSKIRQRCIGQQGHGRVLVCGQLRRTSFVEQHSLLPFVGTTLLALLGKAHRQCSSTRGLQRGLAKQLSTPSKAASMLGWSSLTRRCYYRSSLLSAREMIKDAQC